MGFINGYYYGKNGHNFDDIGPVGGVLAIIGLGVVIGGSFFILNKDNKDKMAREDNQITLEQTCVFSPGEHIIAMPIEDPTKEVKTYEGHAGYKPVGISTSAYGKYGYTYGEGYILYENIVDVNVSATGMDEEGNYVYSTFGTPVEVQYNASGQYDAYEHIVSVPYSGFIKSDIQIEYHDGYEIAGIGTSTYGQYGASKPSGCILYTNTEPVEYVYEKNTYFGKPIENEKVLTK